MEQFMVEYWWVCALYATGGILLGYALKEVELMISGWRSRRRDRKAMPDVLRITGGWRIADDPNRDWATGEDKIPAYTEPVHAPEPAVAAFNAAFNVAPETVRGNRFVEFLASTKPRTPEQYAIEMNPRPYIAKHSTDGYTSAQVRVLNTSTGSFPTVRSLNPAWREAVAV